MPRARRRMPALLGVGWLSLAMVGALYAALLFAQPTLCDGLGGEWFPPNDACRHELGGNGSNDPGETAWPW